MPAITESAAPKRGRRSGSAKVHAAADGAASLQPLQPTPSLEPSNAAAAPSGAEPSGPSCSVDGADGAAASAPLVLPLPVDTVLRCLFHVDGQFHNARVVSRRPLDRGGPGEMEYYMHFINVDRRMDSWLTLDKMDLSWHVHDPIDEKSKGQKRKFEDIHDQHHGNFDANEIREHEEFTKVKNVERIELGRHEMETWYFSPLPPEFANCKKLYVCEFTLAFFPTRQQLLRHIHKVTLRRPPGDEIYRNGNVSMFEVDGHRQKAFCQNLCFLAKLFLDHKTLYYDVDLFLFYVLCEVDSRGAHVVGYFSKEKKSEEGYNLACILTLPAYQRKGYGKALISMSYELSRIERKVGSPEKPLSDLGLVSYRSYWIRTILNFIKVRGDTPVSINEMAETTCIKADDIIDTLSHLNMLRYQRGHHVIFATPAIVEQHLKSAGSAGLVIDPLKIIWVPYNPEREYDK